MFKTYDSQIKKLLSEKNSKINWKNVLENHKSMIAKIQHERLIHLLVTIFVGTIMSASAFITIITKQPDLIIFFIPLTFLFIGYLFHYRFLENTTQNWYLLEEEIKKNFKSID
jgi:hypothetical protein